MTTTEKLQRIRDKCVELISKNTKILDRYQKCGCIVCICDDDERCHGCGAQHCGTHAVGKIPEPVYSLRAGAAEAAWKSTIAAVDFLLRNKPSPAASFGFTRSEISAINAIIAAWPEELL
jgi:hypothetical protein